MPLRLPPFHRFRYQVRCLATRQHVKPTSQLRPSQPASSTTSPHKAISWRESILADLKWFLLYGTQATVALHLFAAYVYGVEGAAGPSMLPTIGLRGDWLVTSKLHRRGRGIQVGDLVEAKSPWEQGGSIIKRVIGMPGDFVKYEHVSALSLEEEDVIEEDDHERNEKARREMFEWEVRSPKPAEKRMVQVPEGHCWIEGDNLPWSKDSRVYGPIPLALINGKVIARILPFRDACWFENPLKKLEPGIQ